MSKYLADTTVLIEHLRGNKNARLFLNKYNPSISSVTIAELIQGSRNDHELTTSLKLCTSLSAISIDKKISNTALQLLQKFNLSHGLLFLDALIGATVLENNMILVTGNVKHFKLIDGLEMVPQETIFKY